MANKILNWIKQHKIEFIILMAIMLLGGTLRLYHVGDWMHLGNDEGRHIMAAANIIRGHDIVLLGPAAPNNNTSFHLGPFYYYLLAPFVWLWGMSPAGGAWADALFAIASILLVFHVSKTLVNSRAGLIAAALFASSFLMVYYGRWVWNPNFVPFFALLIILCLYHISRSDEQQPHRSRYLYFLAVNVGLVIQLHGTAILVLPPLLLIYFFIFRPRFLWKQYAVSISILLFVNIPYLYYDLTHRFSNSIGFWHVLTQSNSNEGTSWLPHIWGIIKVWKVYWHEALLHTEYPLTFRVLVIACAFFLVYKLWQLVARKKMDRGAVLLALWLFVPFSVFIFYKSFIPTHYFCFVFPLPFLLLAATLEFVMRVSKVFVIICLSTVCVIVGLQTFFSIQLLNDLSPTGSRVSSYPITILEMRQVVDYVIADSHGQAFSFKSNPDGSYDEGYQYLFDIQHANLSDTPGGKRYEAYNGKSAVQDNVELPLIKNSVMIGNVRLVTY